MLRVITLNNNIKLKQFLYLRLYILKQVHERCESCALDNCSATAAEEKPRPRARATTRPHRELRTYESLKSLQYNDLNLLNRSVLYLKPTIDVCLILPLIENNLDRMIS